MKIFYKLHLKKKKKKRIEFWYKEIARKRWKKKIGFYTIAQKLFVVVVVVADLAF